MIPALTFKNGILHVDHAPLLAEAVQFSYLAEPASVGDAQVFLQDYTGFLDNQILLIEEIGTESAEIVTVNGTPSVNAGAVLDSVLVRSHPVGSKVYVLQYDQFELSHATTATGSKTTLTTTLGSGIVAIQPDMPIQEYVESEYSSGYYFARYKNSITATFDSYTDALTYGGWSGNTLGYMVDRVLRDTNLAFSEKITTSDFIAWANAGLDEVKGKIKRWPEHFKDNTITGQVSRGTNIVAMPSDIYDTETNKSVVGFRIGTTGNLTYQDPTAFDALFSGVATTQVRTQATAGSTSLALDNSYDFEDSGTIHVYISGTQYAITYTAVTRDTVTGATAALTGIPASGTGSITVTIPVDTYVWQGETEGIPSVFTVRNGQFEFYPLADSTHDNKNVYADYNTVVTAVDSMGDSIDFQRYNMLLNYLCWRAETKNRNDGNPDPQNGWYVKFKELLNDAIRTLPMSRVAKWMPRINKMNTRGYPRYDAIQRIPTDQQ
jgi:hypothetical protein